MLFEIAQYQDERNSIIGIAKCLREDCKNQDVFDLVNCQWMQIGEVVALASFFRTVRAGKTSIEGRYRPDSNVGTYLARMNFFKVQDIVREERFERHNSEQRFLPLTLIRRDENANEIPAKLRNIVLAKTSIDDSLLGALDYAFGEVIDNVLMHSRTPVEGLVGAQYYPKKGFVEFCVADGGMGVARTLRNNSDYSKMSDPELLVKAFEHGVGENTSDFNHEIEGYGCGFGLTFAARLVEATGGDLWMVSNSSAIHLHRKQIEVFEGFAFKGTVLCMRIPADVQVSEDDVMRNGVKSPYGWDSINGFANADDDILW